MKCCIIGCGWLGKPLAMHLFSSGYKVAGSVRTEGRLEELIENQIDAFLYDGKKYHDIPVEHRTSDWLIICFPPSKSEHYSQQIKELVGQFSPHTQILFTSSTGGYFPNAFVDEKSEVNEEHMVRIAERVVIESDRYYIIFRLAGLIGGERHPVKQLSGKHHSNGNHPVNLVGRTDVIRAILAVIASGIVNEVFNISYPEHPTRAEYYTQMALKKGLPLPSFDVGITPGKTVDGSKIERMLNFSYSESIF